MVNPAPERDHFGLQTAPTLIGSGTGSVTSYLGIGTTFIKNTSGPMFVIAGSCELQVDGPRGWVARRVRYLAWFRVKTTPID